jgi:hypothetical protein
VKRQARLSSRTGDGPIGEAKSRHEFTFVHALLCDFGLNDLTDLGAQPRPALNPLDFNASVVPPRSYRQTGRNAPNLKGTNPGSARS